MPWTTSLIDLRGRSVGVTGAAGRIGRRLVARLTTEGVEVAALDQRPDAGVSGVRWVQGDVNDFSRIEDAFRGVDSVVHLAGVSSAAGARSDPAEASRTNVAGTEAVLEACGVLGVSSVVFTSTGLVYGPRSRPSREDDCVRATGSPYAETKLFAERACEVWAMRSGRRVEIARLSNLFGSDPPATVVGEALRQAASGGPIRLRDHRPIRDFIYIDDAVEAILLLISLPGEGARVTNVSTGVGRSIGELAHTIGRIGACVVEDPSVTADCADESGEDRIVLDNQRLQSMGFAPRVAFASGLAAEFERHRAKP